MNVSVEKLPHSQSVVTVEVEPERMVKAKEEAFRRIAREVVVPGFRKGKAPRHMVERFVRPEAVQDDADAIAMDEVWTELRAGQFKEARLFDTPQVRVTQREPLTFTITLTTEPTVELGDYKSIRIAPELVTVTEQDVTETLDRLRDEQATWQPVLDRPVRAGDQVTLQAHGTQGNEPITVPEGYSLVVSETASWLAPGFAMRLVDMPLDTEKEFAFEVPASGENAPATSGVAFVTVKEIKEKVLPELDDTFAKTFEVDTLDALKEKISTTLRQSREDGARARLENKLLDAIAGVSSVNFPAVMTDQQVDAMVDDRRDYLRQRGLDLNMYLSITGSSLEKMKAELAPEAERRIRNFLLVDELSHAEGIVVEDSAVNAEIERLVSEQTDQEAARKELSTNQMHDRLRTNLHVKALLDRMIAMVTDGQTPVAPESAAPAEPETAPAAEEKTEPEAKPEGDKPKLIIATH